ncbi:MAG: hypothetical protein QME16_01375, partial [Planctomycetota bacterium]|nr:hypothetical protein [Planctomycetota bacterium]
CHEPLRGSRNDKRGVCQQSHIIQRKIIVSRNYSPPYDPAPLGFLSCPSGFSSRDPSGSWETPSG